MPAAAEEQGWGGERNTLQVFPKASPLKHRVKNGVTQKTRKTEMQGVSNPQILSTFTSEVCRRLITDLVVRLKKLLSHPLLLVRVQETQASHKPYNNENSNKFPMTLLVI